MTPATAALHRAAAAFIADWDAAEMGEAGDIDVANLRQALDNSDPLTPQEPMEPGYALNGLGQAVPIAACTTCGREGTDEGAAKCWRVGHMPTRFQADVKAGTRCSHERRWTDPCSSCGDAPDTPRRMLADLAWNLAEAQEKLDIPTAEEELGQTRQSKGPA